MRTRGDRLLSPATRRFAWTGLVALSSRPPLLLLLTFLTAGCGHAVGYHSACGNGVLDPGESCDGANLGGQACPDLGFEGGTLTCREGCDLDLRGCVGGCGNGVREAGEACDGSDLGPETCADLGHEGGVLACGPECVYDESRCYACGDGTCQAEDGETVDGCPAECGWERMSAARSHTCGVRADGSAWCWGGNDVLQLGSGVLGADELSPIRVETLSVVANLSANATHACVVQNDGTAWCWGSADYGQLGNGTNQGTTLPEILSDFNRVVKISAGAMHTCTVDEEATVWCWGNGEYGQLGNGCTAASCSTPWYVSYPDSVRSISAGGANTCAIDADEILWCWGDNSYGQVGDGTAETNSSKKAQVLVPPGVTMVSCGGYHNCALDNVNEVWCWGSNESGQIGTGDSTGPEACYYPLWQPEGIPCSPTPHRLSYFDDVHVVVAGSSFTCVLRADTSLLCWGLNDHGQLGDGSTTDRLVPTQVSGLIDVVAVSAGFWHACAVKAGGSAWCWGRNDHGQLGDGTTVERHAPVRVVDLP